MYFSRTKSLLTLATIVGWLGSVASADELTYSDLGKRLVGLQSENQARSDVQLVAYVQDQNAVFGPPAPLELADPVGSPSTITDQPLYYNDGAFNGESDEVQRDYYAEVQFMLLRAHVTENAVGKLSEQYQLSPRFVIGYESARGIGGRIRFWHYDQSTPNLTDPTQALRFEFDIVDIEGTGRFGSERAELVVAGGFRWGDARITLADAPMNIDMPGITFAADLRTIICRQQCWELANIGGARWSIMGGDWDGASNGFLASNRDDNLTVTEIYGGFEYIHHLSRVDVFARIAFEVQTWHSDVASQTAGGDSINFMGPGLHLGVIR